MNTQSHDSEVPAKNQQVLTACAFIHHNFDGIEKVFMAKRATTKKFLPGVYEIPGGHIDFGEDMTAGLKREIKEEFEMDIAVGDPFGEFSYTNPIKGSHSLEVMYFATFVGDIDAVVTHPEDHSEYGWFAEAELDQTISTEKAADDPEFVLARKGFALLRGESLQFG